MITFSLITTIPLNRADSYLYRNLYRKSFKESPLSQTVLSKRSFYRDQPSQRSTSKNCCISVESFNNRRPALISLSTASASSAKEVG